MASWIYLFSKFTPESLLFEALAIFILVCTYTAFWILRKYKYGSVAEAIPASVVRDGLNQLIGDAEALRAQLFGIIASSGQNPSGAMSGAQLSGAALDPALLASFSSQRGATAPAPAADPELKSKLAAFEAKMAEQSRQLETIQSEKMKLEQDLVQAKAVTPSSGGGPTSDSEKLKDKIANLEARLAEYSVIEDDLANLKRLQQENLSLKTALASKPDSAGAALNPLGNNPIPTPAPAVAAASSGSAASAAASASGANPSASSSSSSLDPSGLSPEAILASATTASLEAEFKAATSAAATSAPAAAAAASAVPVAPVTPITPAASLAPPASTKSNAATPPNTPAPNFETLVDSVEKSLQPADSAVDSLIAQKPSTPTGATAEKSDEDLISEFEKMLNS